MSTPVVALALAAMCALFSAAAADTAQGLRNHAANEARRVATSTIDSCASAEGPRGARCRLAARTKPARSADAATPSKPTYRWNGRRRC